jgi:hypothetical protein
MPWVLSQHCQKEEKEEKEEKREWKGEGKGQWGMAEGWEEEREGGEGKQKEESLLINVV